MNPPAWSVVAPAIIAGVNGSGDGARRCRPGRCSIAKLLDGAAASLGALHGVKSAFVVYVPHAVGVASAACAPPLKDSLKSVNGSCGVFSNVVVSWPVVSFRCTSPTSFT